MGAGKSRMHLPEERKVKTVSTWILERTRHTETRARKSVSMNLHLDRGKQRKERKVVEDLFKIPTVFQGNPLAKNLLTTTMMATSLRSRPEKRKRQRKLSRKKRNKLLLTFQMTRKI